MRIHSLVPDDEGGAYLIAQKRFLGIGGKQTLIHCPVQGVMTSECGVVMQSGDVNTLGPVQYQPDGASSPGEMDLWGDLSSVLDELQGLDDLGDGIYDPYPWDGGAGDRPMADGPSVDCPDGAVRDVTSIPEGTTVTLIAVHPDDAYSGSEHERSLPLTGIVDGDLHTNDGCWLGGGFEAENGTEFYFYKAAFRLD